MSSHEFIVVDEPLVEPAGPGQMLVKVKPPRMISRVLVVDKTIGLRRLSVHIQASEDGTMLVQVSDA